MDLRGILEFPVRTRLRIKLCHVSLVVAVFLAAAGDITSAQDKVTERPTTTPTPSPTPSKTPTEPDDKPIRVETNLVTMTLTVQDQWGRYVSDLAKKNFTVFENDVEQEISFFSEMDAPASIGIIYDVSGSMGSGKILRSRSALQHFMKTSHPSDEYSLIAFNDKVRLLADRTRDHNLVLDKLLSIQAGGNTAFYDAVYLGVDRVMRGAHSKRALLIISDGQDNSSRYNLPEVRRYLKEADVIIYSVGIYIGDEGMLGYQGQGFLRELSEITGGQVFYPRSDEDMDDLFERIALELRHQYSVGYLPKDFNQDGKWRKLRVKVAPPRGMPRLSVRGRKGYYATPVSKDN